MVEVMIKFDFKFQVMVRFFFVVFVFLGNLNAWGATLKDLILEDNPSSLKVTLSEKVPFKIIRIDAREFLIAFKNVDTAKIRPRRGKTGSPIKNVSVEPLANGVMALVVTGNSRFKDLVSSWDKTGTTLVVNLDGKPLEKKEIKKKTKVVHKSPPPPEQKKPQEKQPPTPVKTESVVKKGKPDPGKTKTQPPKDEPFLPIKRASSIFKGDINDILLKAELDDCHSQEMAGAVDYLKKRLWSPGKELLEFVIEKARGNCLEQACYLRAYAAFMEADPGDAKKNLAAMALFQDAFVDYPNSKLLPFALAGMGILHTRLKNPAAAEGFFAIIRDNYKDYPGLAQVLYQLGLIYDAKGFNEQALAYFKEVFEDLPENSSTVDAGIGIGKALFKKRFYIDSLKILSQLLKSNPEKTYDSPELLLSIGNANFELGRTQGARENLTRALNLFPAIVGKDMIMTNIAETYAIEKNNKKAESLYRLVIKTYPKGEGFINSSMGLALILDNMEEKKSLYEMVKKDFSEHKLASVAMMRLAEIYEKTGEYAKCIEEIESLLSTHPQGLRYDAVKLMQRAYEALFDKKLSKGDFPGILHIFEQKNDLLDRMESKQIYLTVGLAYLEAGLHEQAFNQLIKAYKLYPRDSRPASLLFGLGVAMDETHRKEDALKILTGFVKRFPTNDKVSQASFRMGNLLVDKGMFGKAVKSFDVSYGASKDRIEKGRILIQKSEAFKAQKEWPQVSTQLVQAAREFGLAPGSNYDLLASTHIKIGESYLEQRLYVKAAQAFVTALKFAGGEQKRVDVGFMLGDAYQKANALTKARETFEKIVSLDDSIWVRLAKERLATLDLAEKVKNS